MPILRPPRRRGGRAVYHGGHAGAAARTSPAADRGTAGRPLAANSQVRERPMFRGTSPTRASRARPRSTTTSASTLDRWLVGFGRPSATVRRPSRTSRRSARAVVFVGGLDTFAAYPASAVRPVDLPGDRWSTPRRVLDGVVYFDSTERHHPRARRRDRRWTAPSTDQFSEVPLVTEDPDGSGPVDPRNRPETPVPARIRHLRPRQHPRFLHQDWAFDGWTMFQHRHLVTARPTARTPTASRWVVFGSDNRTTRSTR